MNSSEERYQQGRARIEEIFGVFAPSIRSGFEDVAPDFFRYADEYVFGGLWSRPGLDLQTRSLIVIGTLAALGIEYTLGLHIRGALTQGVTKEEIIEAIMQVAPYGGHPRAIAGFRVADQAFKEWDQIQTDNKTAD
jgi:4-carboxymuconolactone decarboxylase